MSSEVLAQVVARFFGDVDVASLKLPDAWFGRPLDNCHQRTAVRQSDRVLVVELDGQLRLSFHGPLRAEVAGRTLRLTGFTRLDRDRTEYGSPVSHHEEFDAGSVELIGPPG